MRWPPAIGARLSAGCVMLALLLLAPSAWAQWNPSPYPELRADAIIGRGPTFQAGAGPVLPLGYYVRVAVVGAAGITRRDGIAVGSGRVDITARYLLDPFRETRHALSLGGGVSLVGEAGKRVRPYLVVLADVEGPSHAGWSPALQVGLGGGARVGVVLRRSRQQNR